MFLPQEYRAFQGGIHRYATQTQQVRYDFFPCQSKGFSLERKSEAVEYFSSAFQFQAKKVEFAKERENLK